MNLFNINPQNKEEVKTSKQAEVKKEIKYIKSERKIAGLRLYEYNEITREIKEATYIKTDFILDFTKADPARDFLSKFKVKINPNCKYIQAINIKNALKKIDR